MQQYITQYTAIKQELVGEIGNSLVLLLPGSCSPGDNNQCARPQPYIEIRLHASFNYCIGIPSWGNCCQVLCSPCVCRLITHHCPSRLPPNVHFILTPHEDAMASKYLPHYWPFVRRIWRSPMDSPHKGTNSTELWICSFVVTNYWTNSGISGDLCRHDANVTWM